LTKTGYHGMSLSVSNRQNYSKLFCKSFKNQNLHYLQNRRTFLVTKRLSD
jgi:hypothetical protein